jgi:hypothetical protein
VVGYELVDVAVLVPLGLRMADQYDHLEGSASLVRRIDKVTYAGFPHVGGHSVAYILVYLEQRGVFRKCVQQQESAMSRVSSDGGVFVGATGMSGVP